jgi:hypothetical protein
MWSEILVSRTALWISRITLVSAVVVASVIAGAQLREVRESAASRTTASPSAVITPLPTVPIATPSIGTGGTAPSLVPPGGTTVPGAMTSVPSPLDTPRPSLPPVTASPTPTMGTIFGRVLTAGGAIKNAEIVVYSADASANGPTPVPPTIAHGLTAPDGTYLVAVPPGTYRVGAHIAETIAASLQVWPHAWYGGGYAIGLGKDLVVGTAPTQADIQLIKTFTVSGRVVGRDGVGVPRATVSAIRRLNVDYPLGGVMTDSTGQFALTTPAMPIMVTVQAGGPTGISWADRDLDVQGDVSGLQFVVDRGNVISGTLRDSAGRALAATNIGVAFNDSSVMCGASCNAETDSGGHFLVVIPSGTMTVHTWPRYPNESMLYSKEYVISADASLDIVVTTKP